MSVELIKKEFRKLAPFTVKDLKHAPDARRQKSARGENLRKILKKSLNLYERASREGFEKDEEIGIPGGFSFRKEEKGKFYEAGFHGRSIVNGVSYDSETSSLIREIAVINREEGTSHHIGFHSDIADLEKWENVRLPKGYKLREWDTSTVFKHTAALQLLNHDFDPRYPWVRNRAKMIFHGNKLVATVEPTQVVVYREEHLYTVLDHVVKPILDNAKREMH